MRVSEGTGEVSANEEEAGGQVSPEPLRAGAGASMEGALIPRSPEVGAASAGGFRSFLKKSGLRVDAGPPAMVSALALGMFKQSLGGQPLNQTRREARKGLLSWASPHTQCFIPFLPARMASGARMVHSVSCCLLSTCSV